MQVEGNTPKQALNGGRRKRPLDKKDANDVILQKNMMIFGGIYLQGGTCDRGVETILERRLLLSHSTLAGAKKATCVIPYHYYDGGGCVNPHQSYDGEAPQTLTTPMLAGFKNPRGQSLFLTSKNALQAAYFHLGFWGCFPLREGLSIVIFFDKRAVEGNAESNFREA